MHMVLRNAMAGNSRTPNSPLLKTSVTFCQKCRSSSQTHRWSRLTKTFFKRRLPQVAAGATAVFACYKLYRQKYDGTNQDPPQEKHRDPFCKGSSGVLVKHGNYWLPSELFKEREKLQKIRDFNVKDDDVIVASFPKSGTTWLQEIVYLIINDLDLESATKDTIEARFPYIEYVYPGLRALEKLHGQRLMKTHLPLEFLPHGVLTGRGKLVYIARNPKDVSVSLYHFLRMLSYVSYEGHFYDLYTSFLDGKIPYGPWTTHVLQYWQQKQQGNMLFLTYEELHKNPKDTVQKIAGFLGKTLSEEQATTVVQHCSFQNMRDNPNANYSWWKDLGLGKPGTTPFMRKGKVGDWKTYYSSKMNQDVETTLVQPLSEHGLVFQEEL